MWKKSNGPIVWKTENDVSLIDYLKQNPFLIDNMEYNSTTKVIIDYVCKFEPNNQENLSSKDISNDIIEKEKTSLEGVKDTVDINLEMIYEEYIKNNTINLNFAVVNGIIINKNTQKTVDNNSIDCLKLSTRAYNALRRENIISLKDLLSLSFNDINKIKNLGVNSINEIINKLDLYLTNKTDSKNTSIDENASNENISIGNGSIDNLNLSVRAKNSLRRIGIFNTHQLIKLEDAELYHIKNCGEKTILEIISVKEQLSKNIANNVESIPNETMNYLKDFFEELSYFDITEVQLYIIQSNLICLLDGTEIDKISYYNKWYLEVHIQEYIKNYILKVFNENHFYGVSLVELKSQIIKNTLIQEEALDKILEDLKNNILEQVQENRYILKYSNVLEYISNLDRINNQSIFVLEKRMNGETLASISNDLNITKERVRQIQSKCINIIHKELS